MQINPSEYLAKKKLDLPVDRAVLVVERVGLYLL